MHSGNPDQEGAPISFNFTEYDILEIQRKHLLCVKQSGLDSYGDGVIQVAVTLQELWKRIRERF